jgi:hypothetical protein
VVNNGGASQRTDPLAPDASASALPGTRCKLKLMVDRYIQGSPFLGNRNRES